MLLVNGLTVSQIGNYCQISSFIKKLYFSGANVCDVTRLRHEH